MSAIDVTTWKDLFPDSCRIESFETTRNARNEAKKEWQSVPGLEAIDCAVRFARGSEQMVLGSKSGTGVQQPTASHAVKLAGFYGTLKSSLRAVVTDSITGQTTTYEIQAVAHTSGKSRTKLICTTA